MLIMVLIKKKVFLGLFLTYKSLISVELHLSHFHQAQNSASIRPMRNRLLGMRRFSYSHLNKEISTYRLTFFPTDYHSSFSALSLHAFSIACRIIVPNCLVETTLIYVAIIRDIVHANVLLILLSRTSCFIWVS